jgi:mRNA-degrading endonuclease RelE of RelBE toxin-antitoxin system
VNYEFKPSFEKSIKNLPPERRHKIRDAVESLIDFFETGQRKEGLGLKQLRWTFWEIRADIRDRIIFEFDGNSISFILAGNHDEIKRFLKRL